MNTTKKIALSCAIGGAICAFVAVMVNPAFWWLGTIAGFAGGYLAYEFKKVLNFIPEAIKYASKKLKRSKRFDNFLVEIKKSFKDFFKEKHPYLYATFTLATIETSVLYFFVLSPNFEADQTNLFHRSLMIFCVLFGTGLVTAFCLAGLRSCADREKIGDSFDPDDDKRYGETYLKIAKGSLNFFLFTVSVIVGWFKSLPAFIFNFIVMMFKLIHSNKRLLCGIDAALGGAISYFLFSPANSIAEIIVTVTFGGLIGAFLGILSWEIVSKRWLKISST